MSRKKRKNRTFPNGRLSRKIVTLNRPPFSAPSRELPFTIDTRIILIAFSFSAMIGMTFGYFPARRAARLDPIEALRHE
jgi:putative ABC transport system permease protein